ncbi:MAG: hypothetical protein R2771_16530 [Saprospiraceae bacterium]
MRTILLLSISIFFSVNLSAQSEKYFGVSLYYQLNSATLPDVELNSSISQIINGAKVADGVVQYADIRQSARVGVFGQIHSNVGFFEIAPEYVVVNIYKEFKADLSYLGEYTIDILDTKLSYLDVSLSWNLFLDHGHHIYLGAGIGFDILVAHSGLLKPENYNYLGFLNLGVDITENIGLRVKPLFGLNEVYKNTYIHNMMLPIGISIRF